jgi:hypothetical protein
MESPEVLAHSRRTSLASNRNALHNHPVNGNARRGKFN